MSKAVLISIRPEWCQMIANGKKTVEVRKSRPKLETPFKCYIYCTVGGMKRMPKDYLTECFEHGKVIGEFVCDRIFDISVTEEGYNFDVPKMTGLKYEEMESYLNRKTGYGWHISDLMIYDKPKELSDFTGLRDTKFGLEPVSLVSPPQSWCYVEELSGNSEQLVEVIRCKDCIGQSTWFKAAETGCEICGMSGMYPKGEFDSCSYGKRKKGAD